MLVWRSSGLRKGEGRRGSRDGGDCGVGIWID